MATIIKLTVIAVIVFLLAAADARANVTLPDILGDSMVLQRERPTLIWGQAEPGENITVTFAGQKRTAVADQHGEWSVYLAVMKANATPATLVIQGNNRIELKDILVGEVWLVAGQSNMQFQLSQSVNSEQAVAAANYPQLRLFNVSRSVAFKHAPPPLGRWQACTPDSAKQFSAAGYYFGVELQKALRVPVGLINSSYGGSQAEAWTPVEYLIDREELRPTVERKDIWDAERPKVKRDYDEAIRKWSAEAEKVKAAGAKPSPSPPVPDALREYRVASSIYDGMIRPLAPFGMRGAIWYQGESNEARAQQYELLLPTMIKAWRDVWGQGDFPFGIIQLPNYHQSKAEPADEPWSHIREAQRRTALSTRRAGLIVTIDIGEAGDIHPKNKLDVGRRMARWALADVYGRKITPGGPMFSTARPVNNKMILTFEDAGAGLRIRDGDRLEEFAIAGADRKWVWAHARIVGKNRIEVWSDAVAQPVAVRYAFNSNPRHPNLTNDSGIPASPFRSDDWPGPTDGVR
jgi:sialate O-acetylesterase